MTGDALALRQPWQVEGQEGLPELDRLIHERVRLGIVSALAVNGTMAFADLKTILDLTDGNLSAHARRLEDAGYLRCTKTPDVRGSRTEYTLTDEGRRELEAYLDHMEALIRAMRGPELAGGKR
jgi:DNA-binding MarR family transcriptional regulator